MSHHSSSFASGDHHVATAGSSLASVNETEPTHFHNVDIYLWEISYQSATASQRDIPPSIVTSASSPSPTDSGTSSHPQQSHRSPTEGTDQHRSVSPTTPVAIDYGLANSPPEEGLLAQNQDPRRALCPECRAYTSKRSFNMKRHQKSCHKKAPYGQTKETESPRSRGSDTMLF